MNQLLETCGPARVLEVRVPAGPEPHRVFPLLASSPAHAGDTIDDILAFVSRQTGWSLPGIDASDAPPDAGVEAVAMDWRYRLETKGWTVRKPGTQALLDWGSSEWRLPLGENVLRLSIQLGRVPISLDGPELEWKGPHKVSARVAQPGIRQGCCNSGVEYSFKETTSVPDPDGFGCQLTDVSFCGGRGPPGQFCPA